jgi:hypothetical protein
MTNKQPEAICQFHVSLILNQREARSPIGNQTNSAASQGIHQKG